MEVVSHDAPAYPRIHQGAIFNDAVSQATAIICDAGLHGAESRWCCGARRRAACVLAHAPRPSRGTAMTACCVPKPVALPRSRVSLTSTASPRRLAPESRPLTIGLWQRREEGGFCHDPSRWNIAHCAGKAKCARGWRRCRIEVRVASEAARLPSTSLCACRDARMRLR